MAWDVNDKIRYENDLINQRLTWLGTFEGLLFVANHYAVHPYIFPLLGLAFAVSVDFGIRAANRQITKYSGQAYKDWRTYLMPGTAIPKIIASAWIILLLEKILRDRGHFNFDFLSLIAS